MFTSNKALVIVLILGTVFFTFLSVRTYQAFKDPSSHGIIALDGYPHGVALCGESSEKDTPVDTQDGEYHMWAQDHILYTINYGHMTDRQVGELVALATVQCNNLK